MNTISNTRKILAKLLFFCMLSWVIIAFLSSVTFADEPLNLETYSDAELQTLHTLYKGMLPNEIQSQIDSLMSDQLLLNIDLNKPANQNNPARQKELRTRIVRIHQEVDMLEELLVITDDPEDPMVKYRKPILIVGGLIIVLLLLFAFSSTIKKMQLKATVAANNAKALKDQIPDELPEPPLGTNVHIPNSIEIEGVELGNTPKMLNSNTIPLQDIQAHVDNMLINESESYNKLIDFLFGQAVHWHASDIHMSRSGGWFEFKFRIDGQLHNICVIDLYREREILNIVKVMANLKHFEKREAQEGRLQFTLGSRVLDFRISVIPILDSEKIVARIFGDDEISYDLNRLGMTLSTTENLQQSLKQMSGLILLVGPTGSGKTTTIYSALNYLNKSVGGLNITSLEDPVEHTLQNVTQVQINPRKNLTYETGIVQLLRQDPEAIMIGEIRDSSVAKQVVRAAYTGHLIISTVHATSTLGAVDRMLEFGVDSYNLHNSLTSIVSQRLAKQTCASCMEKYEPHPAMLQKANSIMGNRETDWLKGRGCDNCMDSGYRGRIIIEEMMSIDSAHREMLVKTDDRNKRREILQSRINHSLLEDGIHKAAAGLTTLEEVATVVGGFDS